MTFQIATRRQDDPRAGHDRHPPDREAGGPNTVTPHLHPGQRRGVLRRCERRLARSEPVPHRPVDVEPVRGEGHARRIARRIALADDDDRVGRILRVESVRSAEGGRVGKGRVARDELARVRLSRRSASEPGPASSPFRLGGYLAPDDRPLLRRDPAAPGHPYWTDRSRPPRRFDHDPPTRPKPADGRRISTHSTAVRLAPRPSRPATATGRVAEAPCQLGADAGHRARLACTTSCGSDEGPPAP
jgi:hypothetical protein